MRGGGSHMKVEIWEGEVEGSHMKVEIWEGEGGWE